MYNRQENCKFRVRFIHFELQLTTGHSYFRDLLFFNSNNSILPAWGYKIPAESLTLYNGCSAYTSGQSDVSPTLMYNNSSPAFPRLGFRKFSTRNVSTRQKLATLQHREKEKSNAVPRRFVVSSKSSRCTIRTMKFSSIALDPPLFYPPMKNEFRGRGEGMETGSRRIASEITFQIISFITRLPLQKKHRLILRSV